MAHSHSHTSSHLPEDNNARRLLYAFGVTAGFMLVEVVGGFLSGSLALLADAGHMLTDTAALLFRSEVREDFAPLAAIKEYIRLKLEVSRDYPQASRLFCMEMLAGAPLLMDELTGDLKALIDEKSALIAGWVKSGKLAPIDPQHLIFMIWASTQHYADFAPQVEAVTGATLRDEVFFNQTVENVQRIIIEGIRPR